MGCVTVGGPRLLPWQVAALGEMGGHRLNAVGADVVGAGSRGVVASHVARTADAALVLAGPALQEEWRRQLEDFAPDVVVRCATPAQLLRRPHLLDGVGHVVVDGDLRRWRRDADALDRVARALLEGPWSVTVLSVGAVDQSRTWVRELVEPANRVLVGP